MDLEKTIYEILPMAYIAGGVLTLLSLDSQIKFLPGMILIAAGLLVFAWRKSARNAALRQRVNSEKVRSIPRLNAR